MDDVQLGLFDRLPPLVEPGETGEAGEALTIQARFLRFHARNPQVYRALVRLARDLLARGKERLGIGMLWEVLRWQTMIQSVDDGEFKLNDHYRSRYARLIMRQEPDLSDVFEVRRLRAGDAVDEEE